MGRGIAHHSTEEIRRGLTALALHSDNSRRAAAALKAQGISVDERTLRRWRDAHPEQLEEVRTEVIHVPRTPFPPGSLLLGSRARLALRS